MGTTLIRGGRVVDPANRIDAIADVLVRDGVIDRVEPDLGAYTADLRIDADGLITTPGWIDAHVHLRDPGQTYKEDLSSGAKAAVAGGFVRMCCMPNTNPPLDTPEAVADIIQRAAQTGVHIHPIGTISVDRAGLELAPLEAMARAGAIGFSDDGDSTQSADVMRQALSLSRTLNLPIMVHCEDPDLASGGSLHRGDVSREIGDPGIPPEAEESYIERDLELARETGGWLHVLHVSTARGARLIRDAREAGVRVTAEVMPHHLTLTDEWVAGRRRFAGEQETMNLGRIDTNAKVNPPLRPESDALALADSLREGVFDFVATDHAPHAEQDKPERLSDAAFGMIGLELAVPSMARLVARGVLDWSNVVSLFTDRPARTLNMSAGTLSPGAVADITLIDPARSWTVSEATIQSRSKNTPLLGMTVAGRAVSTMIGGKVLHDELS